MLLFAVATQPSELGNKGRSITGGIRAILDLADSMNRDFGENTTWHSERGLRNALKGHKPVGYATWEEDDKTGVHLGLVPLDAGAPRRRRLAVQKSEPDRF